MAQVFYCECGGRVTSNGCGKLILVTPDEFSFYTQYTNNDNLAIVPLCELNPYLNRITTPTLTLNQVRFFDVEAVIKAKTLRDTQNHTELHHLYCECGFDKCQSVRDDLTQKEYDSYQIKAYGEILILDICYLRPFLIGKGIVPVRQQDRAYYYVKEDVWSISATLTSVEHTLNLYNNKEKE